MTFTSTPSQDGVYRIKILNQDLYLEAIPRAETVASTPWMHLASLSASSKKQQWKLTKVTSTNKEWTIASCADDAGLVFKKSPQTYRGHGFPYPEGQSLRWAIQEYSGQYSKISAPSNGSDVFDSQYRAQNDDAVHFWHPLSQSQGPFQCYTFEYIPPPPDPVPTFKMDILFIHDATGSQQPYIDVARNQVTSIASELRASGSFASDDDLRFGLISFRDHPPQDTSFVTKSYPFTSDVAILQMNLASIVATGGGDGPEAQCDALDEALNAAWNDDASKVVMLVTDSPPHGVEDSGDSFPDGCPSQYNPLLTTQLMKDQGIILNVIACEPTLSGYYSNAIDFYRGIVAKTGGDILPLAEPTPNAEVGLRAVTAEEPYQVLVTGFVKKMLDTAKYAAKYRQTVEHQAFVQNRSTSDITAYVHEDMSAAGALHHDVAVENVYVSSEEGDKNARIWAAATSFKEAKQNLSKVEGDRIADEARASGTYKPVSEPKPATKANASSVVNLILKQAQKK